MQKGKEGFAGLGDQVTPNDKCLNTNPKEDSTFSMLTHISHVTLYHVSFSLRMHEHSSLRAHTLVLSPRICLLLSGETVTQLSGKSRGWGFRRTLE